jgi:hypothetical protein
MVEFQGSTVLWGEKFFEMIRHNAILGGPSAPLRWRRLIPTFPREWRESVFRPTTEWKDKVDDLMATLQALGPEGCDLIWWKMTLIVNPNEFQGHLYRNLSKDERDYFKALAFW